MKPSDEKAHVLKAERDHHRAAKVRAMREKAGELEKRAYSLTRDIAVLEGERMRCLIQAEVLRWRADEL